MKNGGAGLPPEARNILVLGAGYIGMALARASARRGDTVWAVRRTPMPAEPRITSVAWDLAAGVPPDLPAHLDAVVLAVAPSGPADGYATTYPPAARAAVAIARACSAPALIYTSSTGVYGGVDGEWVSEATPRAAEGAGSEALIEAEDLLLDAGLSGVTVLRVAGIYGPGRDPRPRFADTSRLPNRGEYWVNLAHRDDIVAAIAGSLGHRGAPRILNVADGRPALAADVARWCAEVDGRGVSTLRFDNTLPLQRSNQRIANAALCATGWQPLHASYREGFLRGL